jgi:AsmA protein
MDFLATVTSRGNIPADWARNLKGVVTLRGKGIELRGRDLDHDLSRFQATQNLDLMDVGSFFFVGPFGLVATKGYDFARLVGHSKGSTRIGAIVSSWKVGGGALQASDVAMATEKNRLALRGRVDFTRQRFDSVTVALVDKDGCAKVRQELRGTFAKPELRKPAVLMSLIGPARSIFTRAKDLLPGQCTVFYAGSVQAPD